MSASPDCAVQNNMYLNSKENSKFDTKLGELKNDYNLLKEKENDVHSSIIRMNGSNTGENMEPKITTAPLNNGNISVSNDNNSINDNESTDIVVENTQKDSVNKHDIMNNDVSTVQIEKQPEKENITNGNEIIKDNENEKDIDHETTSLLNNDKSSLSNKTKSPLNDNTKSPLNDHTKSPLNDNTISSLDEINNEKIEMELNENKVSSVSPNEIAAPEKESLSPLTNIEANIEIDESNPNTTKKIASDKNITDPIIDKNTIKKDEIMELNEIESKNETTHSNIKDFREKNDSIVVQNLNDAEMNDGDENATDYTTDDPNNSIVEEDYNRTLRCQRQKQQVEILKDELRCEEATLCLLRKIIDSQRTSKNGYKSSIPRQQVMPISHSSSKQPQQIAPKSGHNSTTPSQPIKNSPQQPVQKYYIQVGNQLVPAPPPGTPGSGSIYQYTNGVSSQPPPTSSYPPVVKAPPPPPKQTPEQKQNAAKAALRRQLEQTLLQIPPPRPPPADWKAIPNVNSMDFMMLVGLDEVVDSILDNDKKPTLKSSLEALMPYNPRICSQCQVDFSPCWKNKDGNAKGYVVCERCALQNVKKDLKAEHTSRLKSAFLKALKQEQEIEEKIKAGEDVNIGSITGSEKENHEAHSPKPRINSPLQSSIQMQSSGSAGHASSPVERHSGSSSHNHHRQQHQVVQHYPQHTSLVQQLHHQHIQQQKLELDPATVSTSRHGSRWHPYKPPSSGSENTRGSSHHREGHREHSSHHRSSYVPISSNTPEGGSPGHQEYYVVHHPHHSSQRYTSR